MTYKLIILGAGGHALSVANVAQAAGLEIAGFVDPGRADGTLLDLPIAYKCEFFGDPLRHNFAIGVGDNFVRNKVFDDLMLRYPHILCPALIHPSAVVSCYSNIGAGSVLMPFAMVGPNTRVEKFCIINSHSSIDHDGVMESFSSLAPGAVLGGSVTVGQRSAISIGAVVKHGIKIGSDSVLGASSYLNNNLGDNCIAYGSPAKSVRSRGPGDKYLS